MPKDLPFRLTDYLELVDWTGRVIREDKRGAIDAELPPILERLGIEPKHWLFLTQHFESRFKGSYRVCGMCYPIYTIFVTFLSFFFAPPPLFLLDLKWRFI